MKPTEDLYQLIKSLDKNEKGYFKKYGQMHASSGESNYLKLFDAMDALEEYDEDKLLKKFRKEKFVKQLSVAKNYLYDLVLKSLRSYQSRNSQLAKLNAWIENTDVLFSKGLYQQGLKMLEKAKEWAIITDDPLKQIEALTMERKYIIGYKSNQAEEQIDQLLELSRAAIQHLGDQTELRTLSAKILWVVKKEFMARSEEKIQEVEKIISHPLMKNESERKGFYQLLSFYNSWNFYHFVRGETEQAFEYMSKNMLLWETHDDIKKLNPDIYIASSNNYFNTCFLSDKHEEIVRLIERFENFQVNTISLKAKIFENLMLWKMSYGMKMGDMDYLLALTNEITEGLKKYQDKIHDIRVMILKYSLALIFFYSERFEDTLDAVREVMEMKHLEMRKDIHATSRLMNLMIHYELGHDEMLEYIARSTQRYMVSNETFFEIEKHLFKGFNKLSRTFQNEERKKALTEMHHSLTLLLDQNEKERKMFSSFDILSWLESKIEEKSLKETFVKNAKAKLTEKVISQ